MGSHVGWATNIERKMRKTLQLGNSQKKKKVQTPPLERTVRLWLKGIAKWDFKLTQPETRFRRSSVRDLRMTKLYTVLIVSSLLKRIAVKTELQVNQALRKSVSKVQFYLSLQNLLCKVFAP